MWRVVTDGLAGGMALFLAMAYVLKRDGWPMGLGLAVYNGMVAMLFAFRRSPRRTGGPAGFAVAAIAVGLSLFAFRPASPTAPVAGCVVQWLALAGIVASLLSLGRSFGIAPADRGIATGGMYKLVRHPMYACEMLFFAGYSLANTSLRNVLVSLTLVALLAVRAVMEERLLAANPDYRRYAARVRWRFIPGIW